MFGFSRRHMKLGLLKVQLSDSAQGTGSPIRQPKRNNSSNGECDVPARSNSDKLDRQYTSALPEISNSARGSSENWMLLSISGDKPTPRFNVLNFDSFTWTTASSRLYLSPSSLPLLIPACKGHKLVSWGKKALLIGGTTELGSGKISVWAFDTETECWSHVEAKGDIPVARTGHAVVTASSSLILLGGEDATTNITLHMFADEPLSIFVW